MRVPSRQLNCNVMIRAARIAETQTLSHCVHAKRAISQCCGHSVGWQQLDDVYMPFIVAALCLSRLSDSMRVRHL